MIKQLLHPDNLSAILQYGNISKADLITQVHFFTKPLIEDNVLNRRSQMLAVNISRDSVMVVKCEQIALKTSNVKKLNNSSLIILKNHSLVS